MPILDSNHPSRPVIDPKMLHARIRESVEAQLPSAIEDATAHLVDAFVQQEVAAEMAPMMGSFLEKAQSGAVKLDQRTAMPVEPKGLLYDPFTALDQMGFREKPSATTFQTLKHMALRTPPIAAILQTRCNQIAAFGRPQTDDYSLGFKIAMRDPKAAMTPELQKRAAELTKWVMRCGNPDVKIKRPRFGKWLRQVTWDSLAYDQMTSEIVPSRKGLPSYWRALDASSIRISDDLDELDDTEDTIQYVQVYDDTIIAEFTESELMFGVRNPRTDIRMAGYGTSELELLLTIVTAILWGIDYNSKFFKQGTVAKGMINFKGAIPDRELIAFRRHWYSMLSGVDNAWRTPIVNSDDVQWVNMQSSNRDMEFANWMDWLLKVTCAVYQIAPEEIGFQFGNTGQASTLSEGSQIDKIQASKDRGLEPLVRFVAEEIDQKIIEPLDDRFRIVFAGTDARTPERTIDLQTKQVKSIKTVNEVRAEIDLDPIEGGDVILDPQYIGYLQGQQAMQAEAEEGGEGGEDMFGEGDQVFEAEEDDSDVPGTNGNPTDPDEADDNTIGEETQKSFRRILDLEF